MKQYKGKRFSTGGPGAVFVIEGEGKNIDRHRLNLQPSLKVASHSPSGFAWGYGGSGPAQLALALLLDATGDPEAAYAYHYQFKWEKVAKWGDRWGITDREILNWLEKKKRDGKPEGGK